LEIQQKPTVSRNKRHERAFVLALFLTSILRTDKLLKMSVVHRAMQDCWR
jgi:hypothetical protein